MQYWLLKSDAEDYPITQLKKDKKTLWTGVRNYQARNYMWQDMQVGDMCLFYHSNSVTPGVFGICEVTKRAIVDPTQFDTQDAHFDPKSKKEKPLWWCVEVGKVKLFKNMVALETLRKTKGLENMFILRPGNRLSVTPVTSHEFSIVEKLAN